MNTPTTVDVLLVEDNPLDAELTLRALQTRNLANNVFHVTDGVRALDFLFARGDFKAREMSYFTQVVLLDLKLPRLDGLDVLRAMKSDERTRMIPVVTLTSSREEKDVVESYRLGVNSYIVKLMDFDSSSRAVADLGFYWMLLNQPPK